MKKDSISINNILFQRENEGSDKIARIRFKNDLEIINYEFPSKKRNVDNTLISQNNMFHPVIYTLNQFINLPI